MNTAILPESHDKLLSNFTIRHVVETLRELNAAELPKLLRDSGLEHLVEALPADDAPPTVRTSQLARLYATVYGLTGETLTRVFLSNYGHKMAPMLLKHPEMVKRLEQAPSIPAEQRVAWAVRETAAFLSTIWATVALREDAETFHIDVEHCPICAAIRGTHAPICASSEYLYTQLVRALAGKRLTFLEVACRAQGAAVCSYRLRK
jgi:predicted hydrocarbon binding protein